MRSRHSTAFGALARPVQRARARRGAACALALALAGALALVFAGESASGARAATLSAAQRRYLSLAREAVAEAGRASAWGNLRYHWYNELLSDRKPYPLATIWAVVPLFEAVDYIALASPSEANLAQVQRFASHAEGYWDTNITPAPGVNRRTPAYAPYPRSWNDANTFFDDNGWWSLAFLDARQAMLRAHRTELAARYLRDAVRGFDFIYVNGWDWRDGGMWWNTTHTIPGGHGRSGEAIAAATDLAARLYQITGNALYLRAAEQYIAWANHHLQKGDGSYAASIPNEMIMPHDGEGAMIAAFTALCERRAPVAPAVYAGIPPDNYHGNVSVRLPSDPSSWCSWAQALADHTAFGIKLGSFTWDRYLPLDDGPQWDAIYVRGLLSLYALDHQTQLYEAAAATAQRILANARAADGLFLRSWDGSRMVNGAPFGELRTDAASVSVLAALAATPPPS
jgi:hypothetical protein